jgi:hypothetical protein
MEGLSTCGRYLAVRRYSVRIGLKRQFESCPTSVALKRVSNAVQTLACEVETSLSIKISQATSAPFWRPEEGKGTQKRLNWSFQWSNPPIPEQ